MAVRKSSTYIYDDPLAYTAVDPNLIKYALSGSGIDNPSDIFTNWQTLMGGGSVAPAAASGAAGSGTTPAQPAVDYRKLIEDDPYYKQSQADLSAEGIADATQRALAIKKTLIDWGVLPDSSKAADELGLSQDALGYLKSDVDPRTGQFAAQNEAEGLSRHARLAKANQTNVDAIRNQLAARGMYQSGELPFGLEKNAQDYKSASTDAERQVLDTINEIATRFTSGEAGRRRSLTQAQTDAAERVKAGIGSTSPAPTAGTNPIPSSATPNTPSKSSFVLPANTASVWDVNTASTNDAINAAKASGGSVTIRPDDPEAVTKANRAAEAGVPVSIQVNGSADDTPETLAARVKQYQTQFPGASFTLDLESPNFRGGPNTAGGQKMAEYAQQVQAVAGNTPIVITTEGVSDFNYGAWASNPNVIFAPQCYWGDMTPRDVSQIVALLTSQGIPADRIIPVVAPGQSLGSWTGPVSVYGAPTAGTQASQPTTTPYMNAPSTPIGAAQQNAVQSAPDYSPQTVQAILQAVSQAYTNPVMAPTIRYDRSGAGMM